MTIKIIDNQSNDKKLSFEDTLEIIFKQNACTRPIHIFCKNCFFFNKIPYKADLTCAQNIIKDYSTLYMLDYYEKHI
jgi:hypothetical protein